MGKPVPAAAGRGGVRRLSAPAPCRAIVFDFNGTISDDELLMYRAVESVVASHGRTLSHEEYLTHLAGQSDHEIMRRWLGDRDDIDQLIHQRVRAYQDAVAETPTVSAEVRAAVVRAAERVPLAIVSGAALEEIRPVLRDAGIDRCFAVIVASDHVTRGKPHPQGYRKAVALLAGHAPGLNAAEVVAFEDTEAGVRSAVAAGLRCIAVAGTHPPHRLALAHEIVSRIDVELIDRLVGPAARRGRGGG
jgi:HAD superfamily hydrolase (TIGR01509 family)